MFTMQVTRSIARNAVCLALSALIVTASLALGAMGVEALTARTGVVTITQIA